MRIFPRIVQLISWLAIDVVVGAMASFYFFQKLLHVSLGWPAFVLLGLAVWAIYNLDHFLDARKITQSSSPRRLFHRRHLNILGSSIFISVILGLVGAFYWLGWGKEFQLTLVLALTIGACRWIIQNQGQVVLKELSIALFYVLGTLWLPILRAEVNDLSWEISLFVALFFGLAVLNLWMLSFLDREEDRLHGFLSFAQLFPIPQLIRYIRRVALLGIFGALAVFVLLPSFYRPFSCVLLLMYLAHYLTFFQAQLTSSQKRQRMELSFWISWLLLWI